MSSNNRYRTLVDQFRARSEENYIFACQASVPLLLTRDLLYQLWNNFKRYQYWFNSQETFKISHIAISDLLLSPLCREVGHELYEIPKEARDLLFEELVLNLGEKRKNTIAAFLEEYALLEQHFSRRKRLKSIHLLTALSILDPHEMEKQIIVQINEAKTDQEKLNLLLLHRHLVPLGFESDLGKISSAAAGSDQSFSPILIAEEDPQAVGVLNVTLPVALRSRVRRTKRLEEAEAPVNSKALELIRKCIAEGGLKLDLGALGLTDIDFIEHSPIDVALRQCTQLHDLILSNERFDLLTNRWEQSINSEGQNNFSTLPPALYYLTKLNSLFCGGDQKEHWQISDIAGIKQLRQLTYLDLSYNEIEEISGLEELTNLQVLSLSFNKIKKINGNNLSNQLFALDLRDNDLEDVAGLIPLIKRTQKPMILSIEDPEFVKSNDFILVNGNPFVMEHAGVFLGSDKAMMEFVDAQAALIQTTERSDESFWHQIRIICIDIATDPSIQLQFSLTDDSADLEGSIFVNRKVMDEIIHQTDARTWTATKGKALLELLIPASFEKYFDGRYQLELVLDATAAMYPWELLVGPGPLNLAKPLCFHIKIIRQLLVDRHRVQEVQQIGNSALIIGNPMTSGFTPAAPIAEKEAATAADLFQQAGFTTKLLNGQAPEAIITALFSDSYKVIHIAAHGRWQGYPDRGTGVVIGNDLFLQGRDLQQLTVVPELVFLNCDYMGRTAMAQELLQAGVRAVLAPHDFLDDSQAEAFSTAFYQHMLEGMHFAEAVMQTRLAMMPPGSMDFFAATYQCYGDASYQLADTAGVMDTTIPAEEKKKTGQQRSLLVAWLMNTSRQTIGTGFLVTREMFGVDIEDELLLMTCWHVVAHDTNQPPTLGPTDFIARFDALNETETFSLTEIVWASAGNDMDAALLRFEKSSHDRLLTLTQGLEYYPVAEKIPGLNEPAPPEVFIIGYPEGKGLKIIDEGCVLFDRSDRLLQYSRVTRPGSAGSPVFNAKWELIALHHAGSNEMKTLNGTGVYTASEGISIHAIMEQVKKDLRRKAKKKVFLSSTYSDLKEYRDILIDFFHKVPKNFELIAFESFFAGDKNVIDRSLDDLRMCDIMVLLIADKYGYIPYGDDPRSLIEMEFDAAIEYNKPVLVFFITEAHSKDDLYSNREKLMHFKQRILSTVLVKEVRSPQELVSSLGKALQEIDKKRYLE